MKFTAGLDNAIFYSHGSKLIGGLYLAAGETPRPTAILLHGVPGVEKNLDIAYALRDAGWNCLYFHYRGCWGSQGTYSLNGLIDDTRAAAEWLLQQPAVDTQRLALVGNSVGGHVALAAGAVDDRFKILVAMCPLVDPTTTPLTVDLAYEFAAPLNGISGVELKSQWDALPLIRLLGRQLAARKILLVTGDQDELFPLAQHQALVEAVPTMEWIRLANGDHVFSACRKQLVDTVVGWLTARREQ